MGLGVRLAMSLEVGLDGAWLYDAEVDCEREAEELATTAPWLAHLKDRLLSPHNMGTYCPIRMHLPCYRF